MKLFGVGPAEMPAFLLSEYVRKICQANDPPPSSHREIADYLNHAFETSDIAEICKAIGVTHCYNISDIAKKGRN